MVESDGMQGGSSGARGSRVSTSWWPAPAMSDSPRPSRSDAARPSLSVAVVDAAPAGVWQRDSRASAIAAAACRMLDQLGCWDEIAPEAQAITEMIITDSRTSDPVRPVFLTFDGEVAPGEPFAHMVANKVLNGGAAPPRAELGIDIIEGVGRAGLRARPAPACASIWPTARRSRPGCWSPPTASTRKLRDMAGIKTVKWEYGQSGIVCTVAPRASAQWPRRGAFPAGRPVRHPAAHRRTRSSIVWTERTQGCRAAGRRRRSRLRDRARTALRAEARRDHASKASRAPGRSA